MDALIKGHDVHVGDQLRALIAKKTARLDRFLPDWAIVDAKIELHERQSRKGGPIRMVELTVATRGAILRAEATAPDFAMALETAVDRMARQMVRYRARWRDLKRQPADERPLPDLPAEAAPLLAEFDSDGADEEGAALVRTKRFPVKPMSVDEAIEQMELLGHDFFVFFNNADQQTNVVYRRREHGYGLIQPELS
jgi:putative sigma-54 modulation protein